MTSTVVYQDANETITLVTNGDTVPKGSPGYYQTYVTTYTPGSPEDNRDSIADAVEKHLNQLEAWLVANPTGAALTTTDTAHVVRMLVSLGRLALSQFDTVGQAS